MKTAVLIAALLAFPLLIAATAGGMIYAFRGRAESRRGLLGFAAVGSLIVALSVLVPLLILWRAF